jgi:hypothetical protein
LGKADLVGEGVVEDPVADRRIGCRLSVRIWRASPPNLMVWCDRETDAVSTIDRLAWSWIRKALAALPMVSKLVN